MTNYKIAIMTIADLPEGGGNTSRLKTLVEALIKGGHKVEIWNEHGLGIAAESVQKPQGEIAGAPYFYVLNTTKRTSGFAAIGMKILAVMAIAQKLIEAHLNRDIDLIWFNHLSFYDVYPLTLLAKFLGVATIQSYEDERFEAVSEEKLALSKKILLLILNLAIATVPN